ncbi:MAG TPA: ATP/GTP-binding protein [Rhodanobacteraceae bacterium]|nr:ATP/GTP-binding protein [Rhodanobacteraceae bacterium]
MRQMMPARIFFETSAAQLTAQVEQEFFSSLMASNRTYKTTFRQRFADVNPHLIDHLPRDTAQPLRVLDIGISYGVSTAELYDDLRRAGLAATIVATDVLIDACLVRVGPNCHVLLDRSGFPLRFDLPWGSMKPWVIADDYRTGRFLYRKAINVTLTRRARRILADPADPRIKRVRLVAPRLLANDDITVCTDDAAVYNPALANKFDLIRAANVLNKGYFSDAILASMIANARRYLRAANAHLFVVRTHQDNTNHGTLFRLGEGHRFEVVWRLGDGSEIEPIVLASRVAAG